MALAPQKLFNTVDIPDTRSRGDGQVLLAYPVSRSLELTDRAGRVLSAAALSEDIVPSDPTSDTWWRNHTFNSYSPSGQVEGRLVYANFGMPEDFEVRSPFACSVCPIVGRCHASPMFLLLIVLATTVFD